MPKGWSKAPVLDGWVQIVRGPRPKSETWPRAKKHGNALPPGKPKSHSPQVPVRQPSRLPEQVAADAAEEVHRLEAAVQVLGGENNAHAKPLVEALKAARAKSRVPPVSERLTSCRNFLERARKRVTRAEDLIAKAVEQKAVFMQEVAEAEERLKQLEAEESKPMPPSEPGVMELQRRIEELGPRTRRIACLHAGSVVCRRPPVHGRHPTNAKYRSPRAARVAQRTKLRIAQCFGVWRHDHHCQIGRVGGSGHFRDGFFRSNSVVGRHVQINSDVGSDRSGRSEETLPCSWIRCTVPISGGQSCLRSARYGLRGVRIGEASNPGPPQVRPRFSEDGVENVLSSLELELTMLESDEEPLVRSVDGRYVVPRIHDTPPPTVPASFRDLEAVERHPRSVVSSVLDQSTVMDSTHAVQVEIAADDAHGAGRIAVRVDDVRGRPPVAVDMTLADSDTESAVSVPQSEAVSSDRHEDDVSLHQNAGEDSDVDSVSVASGEAPAVPEVDVPLEVPEVRDVSPAIRDAFRRMDGCDVERIF